MQISALIRQQIFSLAEGKLFTTGDLLKHGRRGTVDQTLNRLVKRSIIVRITRGVFMRETPSGSRPSIEEVAKVKAQAFGKNIYSCHRNAGKHALISIEAGSAITFISSGCSSSFIYNKERIYLKRAGQKLLRQFAQLPETENSPILDFEPAVLNLKIPEKSQTTIYTSLDKSAPTIIDNSLDKPEPTMIDNSSQRREPTKVITLVPQQLRSNVLLFRPSRE